MHSDFADLRPPIQMLRVHNLQFPAVASAHHPPLIPVLSQVQAVAFAPLPFSQGRKTASGLPEPLPFDSLRRG